MDAATREMAVAHAAHCVRCAARLGDERALTAGLRAVAARAGCEEAPARVEEALRAAFRSHHKMAGLEPPAILEPARYSHRWALLRVAAALLVVFGLVALLWRQAPPSGPDQRALQIQPPAPVTVAPARHPATEIALSSKEENASPGPQPAAQRPPRPDKRSTHRHRANRGPSRMANTPEDTADSEIATAFIPLTTDGGLSLSDGGQVVRVELPRAALASLGLPVNLERSSEPIKADVVISNDGLARAIRFVR